MTKRLGLIVIALSCAAWGDDAANRAKLIGNWQVEDDSGGSSSIVWSLQHDGDLMRVTEFRGNEKMVEFKCGTTGTECPVKISGKPAKMSMWYNGSALVAMEVRGSDVMERHFSVAGDGDTLQIDLVPISPAGKAEVLHLKRSDLSTAHK